MNREIKFRAWDKLNPQMINHIRSVDFAERKICSEYDLDVIDGNNSGHYHRRFRDIILMQFTGLKDRNQKEIYEGDIVKSGADNILVIKWGKIHESDYYLGWVQYFPKQNRNCNLMGIECCEIIGNIYEHPSLLPKERV